MKVKNKLKTKNNKGITLIALVITIIVLLILAGVSIAMLTGENGILTQAQNAREKTDKATEEEKIQMAVLGSSLDNNGYVDILDEASFKQELANQFGSQSLDVVANGDGSFIITVEDTQRKYYINDDKTVINSDNIIEISTEQQLKDFREDVNAGNSYEGKAVLLTSDITLSDNWTPIGLLAKDTDYANPETQSNKAFKEVFAGENHTIDNLVITSTNNRLNGLFSFVMNGTIRNVTIGKNSEITGSGGAGIVGLLWGLEGNIYNCVNYANTNGAGIVRFLVGQHTISNCKNYGTINGCGGIVGTSNGIGGWAEPFENYSHKIINCGNYGNVTNSGDYCGGIAGYFNGDIINCCNKAEINCNGNWSGGIVGGCDGKLENVYNLNNVKGQLNVGGIIGASGDTLGTTILNCYSLGEVNGKENFSELIGWISQLANTELVNCYTKNDTFTAEDLGDAFKEDTENKNNGYPMLYWE